MQINFLFPLKKLIGISLISFFAFGNFTFANLTAAKNTHSGSHFNQTKKSGLFSSGGLGFTIGKQKQSTDWITPA